MTFSRPVVLGIFCSVLVAVSSGCAALADMPPGFNPHRHMRVDEVKPGMRGYGLTVYHGTKIEPFDVTVLSVERGYLPGKSVVWIRCTDARMQQLGPVQGMSGSPIFLWTDDDKPPHVPGHGGRMIGAFALGYPLGKDCMAGVQPIEQMLQVQARAKMPDPHADATGHLDLPRRLIDAARRSAAAQGTGAAQLWRLNLLEQTLPPRPTRPVDPPSRDAAPSAAYRPMLLPVSVCSAQLAQQISPFMEAMGLQPVAAGAAGGLPPKWLESRKKTVRYEPGSVLAVPMVIGDVDMAAIGTVTDVLDDGTVLAFGHAMYGRGRIDIPIATGFIHFVQPNLQASFKMGGTLTVRGAMVNDENAAVIGKPRAKAVFRPSTVAVRWPDPKRNHRFHYQVAQDRDMLPLASAYTLASSLQADTAPPRDSTILVESTLRFEGNRRLTYRTVLPKGGRAAIMAELPAFISTVTENPFHRTALLSLDSTVQVVPEVRLSMMRNVCLPQTRYEPGQTVRLQVQFTPYRGEPYSKTLTLKLPDDLPDGKYPLFVGGADSFSKYYFKAHPERLDVNSLDDLFQALDQITAVAPTGVYVLMPIESRTGLRIGRTALPRIPSSQRALMSSPTDTQVGRFIETLTSHQALDHVVNGEWQGQIQVKRPHAQDASDS